MEDNTERHKNIKNQLKKLQPTKLVYIVFNKGFRKCEKHLPENKSNFDIIHCNLEIFKHSLKENYSNILVLEDDFIIEESATNSKHINEVNKFCLQRKNKKYMLSLGSIPTLVLPYSFKFRILLGGFGMQAIIYSRKYILYMLKKKDYIYKIGDWDEVNNWNIFNYLYYKPLITQIFPETENRKNYASNLGLTNLVIKISNKLGMDKHPQPGFNIAYIVGHIFSITIIILIIWLLFKFVKYIYNLF